MDSIKLYDKVVLRDIETIKPYWRNPRRNEETVEALLKIIPAVGFNVPIFIDRDGVIVKGHARYKAAVRLKLAQIPCIVSENSEEQNRLDRIADNKLSELAEWDVPELRYELEQIDFPLEDIGFEVPKAEFMEDMYEQQEVSSVSDKDIQRGIKNVSGEFAQENTVAQGFKEASDTVNAANTPGTHLKQQKVVCPDCGKVFYVELRSY